MFCLFVCFRVMSGITSINIVSAIHLRVKPVIGDTDGMTDMMTCAMTSGMTDVLADVTTDKMKEAEKITVAGIDAVNEENGIEVMMKEKNRTMTRSAGTTMNKETRKMGQTKTLSPKTIKLRRNTHMENQQTNQLSNKKRKCQTLKCPESLPEKQTHTKVSL